METKLYLMQDIYQISIGRVFVERFRDIIILLYDFLEKLLCCSLSLEEISYFLFCNIILCYKDSPLSKYKVKRNLKCILCGREIFGPWLLWLLDSSIVLNQLLKTWTS
jgi:hypothetical protein